MKKVLTHCVVVSAIIGVFANSLYPMEMEKIVDKNSKLSIQMVKPPYNPNKDGLKGYLRTLNPHSSAVDTIKEDLALQHKRFLHAIIEKDENSYEAAQAYLLLADLYEKEKNTRESYKYYVRAANRTAYKDIQARAYFYLGVVKYIYKKNGEALSYFNTTLFALGHLSEEQLQVDKDAYTQFEGLSYYYLTFIYEEKEEYSKGIKACLKALEYPLEEHVIKLLKKKQTLLEEQEERSYTVVNIEDEMQEIDLTPKNKVFCCW